MTRPVHVAKTELRRRIRQIRGALDPDGLDAAARAIALRAAEVPELRVARTIATYLAIRREIPTTPLRDALDGVRWAIPRIEGRSMVMVVHGETVVGAHGIPTSAGPEVAVDAVIVPGLAFDAAGRRLGWGGGYYDRWLGGRRVFAVGIALDEAIVDEVPSDDHDQRVHAVVTPTRVLRPDNI